MVKHTHYIHRQLLGHKSGIVKGARPHRPIGTRIVSARPERQAVFVFNFDISRNFIFGLFEWELIEPEYISPLKIIFKAPALLLYQSKRKALPALVSFENIRRVLRGGFKIYFSVRIKHFAYFSAAAQCYAGFNGKIYAARYRLRIVVGILLVSYIITRFDKKIYPL